MEKLENTMKKMLFREKNVFLFLEAFFYKNEKAQNMLEVGGRLVLVQIKA